MKRYLYLLPALFLFSLYSTISLFAQSPEAIVYQAEARDSKGHMICNKDLEIKITILADDPNGTVCWEGSHMVSTDNFGMFSLVIGTGTGGSFDFSAIDWANHTHFLNVQVFYKNKWSDMGTTQFLSVPYALHAETVKKVSNLPNPTDPKDPVTKEYVDALMDAIEKNGISFIDFVSDKQLVPLYSTVRFLAGSTIDANSWNWNFGDGHTSDVINPTHTYTHIGEYSVTLTSSNGVLTRSVTKSDYISVFKTVQQRLDEGETPFELYSDGVVLDSLYGRFYQGGLIFYLNTADGSGMVAAEANIGQAGGYQDAVWGLPSLPIRRTSPRLGDGDWNTNLINEMHASVNPTYPAAAKLCYDLMLNSYDDWFLPTIDELAEVLTNLYLNGYGNFPVDKAYWSSYEHGSTAARVYYFPAGTQYRYLYKTNRAYVRPVRKF